MKLQAKNLDTFLKSVRKTKKKCNIENIGSCIGFLGVIAPAIMLVMRKFSPEYQVKKTLKINLPLNPEQK